MSIQPTFSVIIPTYNGGATLARAIDSILAQSYPAAEIIIIDDGSHDNTAAVVRLYGDKVRYYLQENAGVSAARNKGAELARGEWLAFLDADDWYYSTRLARYAELLQRHNGLDFVIADYHYGNPDGSVIRRSIDSTAFGLKTLAKADEYNCVVFDVEALGLLIPAYFGHTLTFSLPRASFLALGGYATEFSIGEDLHFLIRLCAISAKAGVICEPMGFYCIHDVGLMRSNAMKAQLKTVETLSALQDELKTAPVAIRKGFLNALLNARFDLATAMLKTGRHKQAILAFLPAVANTFSWRSFRLLLSIVKG